MIDPRELVSTVPVVSPQGEQTMKINQKKGGKWKVIKSEYKALELDNREKMCKRKSEEKRKHPV